MPPKIESFIPFGEKVTKHKNWSSTRKWG